MLIFDTEHVDVETLKGPMRMRIFRPKDESRKYPGIVFYPEIFQTTGPIARSAAFFAGHGFVVVVPEVYHEFFPAGTVLRYITEDTSLGNKCKADKEGASWDSDADAAINFLVSYSHCSGAVGTAGFCLGGGLALHAALNPSVKCCASWYGTDVHKPEVYYGAKAFEGLAGLKDRCELLMIFGRQDPHIPPEGRAKIYAAISEAGIKMTWMELNGAHAFMRDEMSYGRYDSELAAMTYQAALQMFGRVLK